MSAASKVFPSQAPASGPTGRVRADLARLPADAIVVEGGARGADRIVREEAQARELHVATVWANWDQFGRSAGYRRNEAMTRLGADLLYAYPLDGPGTRHMIRLAEESSIQVREP